MSRLLLVGLVFLSSYFPVFGQSSGTFTGSFNSGNRSDTFTFMASGNGKYLFTGSTSEEGGAFTSATAFIGTLNNQNIGGDYDYTNDLLTFESNCVETGQTIGLNIQTVGDNISYTISYQFIPTTYSVDPEPNNNFSEAINSIENEFYEGWFNNGDFPSTADTEDWYKFTSPRDGTLVITVNDGVGYSGTQASVVLQQQSIGLFFPTSQTSDGTTRTLTYENFNFNGLEFGIQLSSNCVSYQISWTVESSAITNIPDPNFEQLLIDLGYDDILDGTVLIQNIENVTSLDVSSKNISDITGIEGFASLTEFTSIQNPIITIDFTNNLDLEHIVIINNPITSVNISQNINLTELTVSSQTNTLENIDVSTLLNLTLLEVGTNNLSDLYVGNNSQLTYLNFGNNPISFINLSNNPALEFVGAYNTSLTELDLSNNPAIESISCHSNTQLAVLDLQNGFNNDTNNDVILNTVQATNNLALFCIQVDNTVNAQANPNWHKDAITVYSEDCMYDATLSEPTDLTVSAITSDTALVGWTASTGNTGEITYSIFLNSALFATTTSTSLALTELSSLTFYDVAVSAEDASGKVSGQTNTTFTTVDTTNEPVEIASYYFETGLDGWIDGGSDCGRVNRAAIAFEGNYSIGIRDNSNSSQAISPQLDLSGNTEVSIEFHVFVNSMEPGENFFVEFYDGSTFEIIGDYARGIDFGNNEFFSTTILLDATSYDFNATNRFRIRNNASDNGDRIFFDAVVITGLPMENTRNSIITNPNSLPSKVAFQNTEESIKLYPNPVANNLTIELLENSYDQFTIFSPRGHTMRQGRIHDSSISMDVSDLLEGIYFISFQSKEATIFKRFIKK